MKKTKNIETKHISDNQDKLVEGYGLLKRLNILSEIVLQINSTTTPNEVFNVLRTQTLWLIEHEVLYIALLNRAKTNYQIITLSPIADASGLNGNYFHVDEGIVGWVITNQKHLLGCPNFDQGRSYSIEGKLEDLGIKIFLAVPMKSGNENVGVLVFGSFHENNYIEEDVVIAQLLALQIATIINYASFFDEAKKRITQIEILNELSSKLNSTLEVENLLKTTVDSIQRDFGYYNVSILMFNEDKSELIVKAHSGDYDNIKVISMKHPLNQGLIGWVAKSGEYILAPDVSQDPRYIAHNFHNTKSEIVLPIKIGSEVVGVLNVEDSRLFAFDDMDAIVLQTVCDQLSSALNNARLYKKISEANLKLTELDKMKSEFLGMVSHDFRSPLSAIMLAAKSLLRNEDLQKVERFKEYLTLIVEEANRLNRLAEDTLSITKIESGQMTIEIKIINVERLIKDSISSVRFSNRHRISFTIDHNVSYIKGDQARLQQVLQNLLSNSIKYSPDGGEIIVAVYDLNDEEVLFSVTDNGIGISKEDQDKLFKKYSRIDLPNAKGIKGSGLGLWICKEIVTSHRGKIWVESQLGKGSTFKFTVKKFFD